MYTINFPAIAPSAAHNFSVKTIEFKMATVSVKRSIGNLRTQSHVLCTSLFYSRVFKTTSNVLNSDVNIVNIALIVWFFFLLAGGEIVGSLLEKFSEFPLKDSFKLLDDTNTTVVMDTFDCRPPKHSFRNGKKIVGGPV